MTDEPRKGGKRGEAATPRWVKVFAWAGAMAIVLVVVMLATGHGPGQHMGLH